MPTNEGRLLTREEAAGMLQVRLTCLRRWERTGRIPYVEIAPHMRRFLPADIQAFVAAGRRNAGAIAQ